MKPIYIVLIFQLFTAKVLLSQNLDLFSDYKKVSDDETIEINGNELNFKIMNVCYDDVVFALPSTLNQRSRIAINYNFSTIDLLDTTIYSSRINGMLSNYVGYETTLYFTTDNDTLHIRDYEFSQLTLDMPQIVNDKKFYIPNILTLIGNSNSLWVVTKTADSVSLFSVFENSSGIEFRDTIGLSISNIEIINNDDSYQISHLAGKDVFNNLHYYRFNTVTKTFKKVTINNFQEDLLYVGENDNKSVLISKNGNNLIAYESGHFTTLYSSIPLGTYDSIISASPWYDNSWETNEVVVLTKNNSQINAKIFSFTGWTNIDNYTIQLNAKAIYSTPLWGIGQYGYLEYRDNNDNIFLAQIKTPFAIDTTNKFRIEESPSFFDRTSICFLGIDNKNLPEVKTYLYPNPAKDDFTVVLKNVSCNMEHYLELYNLSGKKLYETPFTSKCELIIPIHDLSSGMYLLKLKINNKIYTRKLMKQ